MWSVRGVCTAERAADAIEGCTRRAAATEGAERRRQCWPRACDLAATHREFAPGEGVPPEARHEALAVLLLLDGYHHPVTCRGKGGGVIAGDTLAAVVVTHCSTDFAIFIFMSSSEMRLMAMRVLKPSMTRRSAATSARRSRMVCSSDMVGNSAEKNYHKSPAVGPISI